MILATPIFIFVTILNRQIACEHSVANSNIALLKPASQSSVRDGFGAQLAVDGNTVPAKFSKILSSDYWQWWLVDLEDIFTIKSFRLSVLNGCCVPGQNAVMEVTSQDPTSLSEFPGFITNAEICVTFTIAPQMRISYPCDTPVTGRYVRLVRRNDVGSNFDVGEFEAYTHVEPDVTTMAKPSKYNLALNKPAQASTIFSIYTADKAFDGIMDGMLTRSGSCLHTAGDREDWHWFTLDLQGTFVIDSVRIMNRVDCCQERSQNFTIEMSEEDPSTLQGFPGNSPQAHVCHRQIEIMTYTIPVVYMCDRPIFARYVRMVKRGDLQPNSNVINICEFEVFGNVKNNYYKKISTSRNPGTPTSVSDRRYVLKCTQLYGSNMKNMDIGDFIHVDLDNGQCNFLPLAEKANTISSSNWVLYQHV